MSPKPRPQPTADQAQLEEQLKLYAADLHALFQQERKEREALAEEKLVLEYRLKELSALNKMFQGNLERQRGLEEAFQNIAAALKQLLAQPSGRQWRRRLELLLKLVESSPAATLAQAPATRPDARGGQRRARKGTKPR